MRTSVLSCVEVVRCLVVSVFCILYICVLCVCILCAYCVHIVCKCICVYDVLCCILCYVLHSYAAYMCIVFYAGAYCFAVVLLRMCVSCICVLCVCMCEDCLLRCSVTNPIPPYMVTYAGIG